MDYEKKRFGDDSMEEKEDYYKNRIIGTVAKEDGTFPRLKQFVRPALEDCIDGRGCVHEIQQELESYLNDLAA